MHVMSVNYVCLTHRGKSFYAILGIFYMMFQQLFILAQTISICKRKKNLYTPSALFLKFEIAVEKLVFPGNVLYDTILYDQTKSKFSWNLILLWPIEVLKWKILKTGTLMGRCALFRVIFFVIFFLCICNFFCQLLSLWNKIVSRKMML